jgi:PilZ domain
MGERLRLRIQKVLPVRVWGVDESGNRFMVDAQTIDISQAGARLEGVWQVRRPGVTIEVRYGNEKAQFEVLWVGKPGTPDAGQIGIRCLEPGKSIWGIAVPAPGPDPHRPAEPAQSQGGADSIAPVAPTDFRERRKHPRYPCTGQVRMLLEGSDLELLAVLREISLGGCYVETMSPMPPETNIEMTLMLNDLEVQTRGTVKVSCQGMGMGVAFAEMTPKDRMLLERMVGRAAGTEEAGPTPEPPPQAISQPVKEAEREPTSLPTISEAEATLETLLKLLARKAVLTREEYVELMKTLKSLGR